MPKQQQKKNFIMKKLIVFIFVCILMTGCADSVPFTDAATMDLVGFWYGWWHGTILPFDWIGSLFSDSISIYAIYNTGGWYDFGFVLGCGALATGASSSTSKRR